MSIIIDDDIEDDQTQFLLQEILNQLKIMNIHFQEWDSMRISEKDLLDGDEL